MSTYVVGDIQGCFEPFQCLLERVKFNPDKDRLWSVGDLINRGPGNIDVLRWFYAHRDNVAMVLGNHDLHLMAVSCGARKPSRKDNLEDILDAPDREQLIEWLPFSRSPTLRSITMVHAGIHPSGPCRTRWTAPGRSKTPCRARSARFLTEMYGNDPTSGTTA